MPDYIVTAKHYAKQEGASNVKERILKLRDRIYREKGIALEVLDIDKPSGTPVYARIEQGAWIADCECGGAQFVDADEPVYYCFGCGNRGNKFRVRPVIFPEQRQAIEALILARPVNDLAGLTELEQAGLSKPLAFAEVDGQLKGLSRNWLQDESVEDLERQNKFIEVKHGI